MTWCAPTVTGLGLGLDNMPPIQIIQGGQFGSEAKGAIAGYLCEKDKVDFNVRTGATNAGHTVYYNDRPYKLQQLGVGWVNPDTTLVVGAGALVDPDILQREISMVTEATGKDIRKRLLIDYRAGLHFPMHKEASSKSGRHHNIGATGKGCSEALVGRIKGRKPGAVMQFGQIDFPGVQVMDTEKELNTAFDRGAKIQLEGTQGQLLDLYLGPYPYTTHKQTGPAQWMLEAGLSPSLPTETIMVVRTFPIRVAGNSGPMKDEITWTILAGQINAKRRSAGLPPIVSEEALDTWEEALHQAGENFRWPHDKGPHAQHQFTPQERVDFRETLSECNALAWRMLKPVTQAELSKLFELTTVTKKLRRIGRFDTIGFETALRQIRPKYIAVTFANYVEPDNWYQAPDVVKGSLIGVPCHLVSYGPESSHIVDLR